MKPGDHIQRRLTKRFPYANHEGVVLEDGQVAHINNAPGTSGKKCARIDSIKTFADGKSICVVVSVSLLSFFFKFGGI